MRTPPPSAPGSPSGVPSVSRSGRPSRARFEEYRRGLFQDRKRADEPAPETAGAERRRKNAEPRNRSAKALALAFWSQVRGHRGEIAFALTTLTISTLLGLVPPAATKFVIDSVLGDTPLPAWITNTVDLPAPTTPEGRVNLLWVIVGAVLAISFVKVGVSLWGRWFATRANKRVQMSVRKRVFEHAVRLPLNRVQDLKSGGIASVLRNDSGSVGDLIFNGVYNPWRAVVQLVGSLIILAFVDWRLLAGAVALMPVIWLTHKTWIDRIRPQWRAVRNTREDVDAQATESFGGMRVVRAFSRQKAETRRNMTGQHLMGRQELHVWWWMRIIEVIWETLIPAASAGLLAYGGYQVIQGELTLGELMMFLTYLLLLLEPIAVLANSATQLQNGLSALDRVMDILEEDRDFPTPAAPVELTRDSVRGRVEFEDVTFRYPAGRRGKQSAEGDQADELETALEEINLVAEPGSTVALVGRSGAGKTTLCNLVARFFDPTEGHVTLDGTDLRDFDVERYRTLLGVVEQDVFLFDGTVADNIAYARPDATLADVEAAAEAANAAEFIRKMPDGLNTFIGERGVKLSGGQRQRLAIARAILADPKILILDEATSNLDTESERLIQSALAELMEGRTSFVIAHRLSTIRDADQIVVLEHGRVSETGTHEELMLRGGRYADMVVLQTEGNDAVLA
ncbi:ABC transporter ATP-binding protein [Alienimonas californiensis]|uniref:Multidrug export ATP-binding/permease protein n=1 Tax=Alienimonas californiensis TaxID=2527989 RepID=A0A517P7N5_9PLAN|nr:ABC transporter ATP-binding protein [Alienimonas californiensis]QDT15391.1 Putative multidrug export ATP-binding/permease protein [Alienimonas californiensis]